MDEIRLHPIVPGTVLPGDWFARPLPSNIKVGDRCVIDSSFCFKHFFSTLPTGLRLGSGVTIWRTAISVEEQGFIEIGDDCYLTDASLVCSQRISIGSRVMIAGGVTIADADFHPREPALRIADAVATSPAGVRGRRPQIDSRPVTVGDDVWIGFNATVLKGVTVGEGAVIAPGAVVVRDVESGTTVAGNPATVAEP